MFASIAPEIRVEAVRIFRVYAQLSMAFAFILSAIIISVNISKTLNPIRALTEGTNKVAGGDFDVSIPVDMSKQDELSQLTDSFNKMARELSLINMLNNDFINNVSHEFKTPISSIQGFATVMLGTDLSDEQREYAEIIAYESARLTRLTSNILRLTKLENQVIVTEKEPFYIDEQIRHSYLLFQNELAQKNIEIDFELSMIPYIGNPELVQQIWHNLLGNAIKFSNDGGLIAINCSAMDDKAVVSIKDNGIGMDRSTVTHIYDKFYQGDRSHAGEGNGLGLSLVNRIVELCEGSIEVNSEPGKGTEFIVKLPLK
jgi:signal transduction histidine kinase